MSAEPQRPLGRFAAADPIFARALDLPPVERAAFLDIACGADATLRSLVEELLAGAAGDAPLVEVEAVSRPRLAPGECVGRWRVVRAVGEGGSAVVYEAERADRDVAQRVALKLLDARDGAFAVRFAAERRILARLEHPAIARFIDGGVDEQGRSWLAVELVAGSPIDVYCDGQRATLRERALLIARVARAVDSAHRTLVVHRDLKPSNVLVTAAGDVKLLDFGIAKVLDADDAGAETRTLGRALTPRWASPEQHAGEPAGIASDVYQLGLLLHQLLAGELPADRRDAAGWLALAIAGRAAPPLASAAAAKAGDGAAACRGLADASALAGALRGDLDTIVACALAVEPGRRYSAARDLATDLEAWAECRPIAARRAGPAYRFGKLMRRHRLASVAFTAAAVLLLAYVPTVTVYAGRAARERDLALQAQAGAEAEAEFLTALFEVPDVRNATGVDPPASELLRRGLRRIETSLRPDAPERPMLLSRLATIELRMGHLDEGAALAERALAATRGSGTLAEAAAANAVGLALISAWDRPLAGQYQRAEAMFRRAHDLRARRLGEVSAAAAESLTGMGVALRRQGRDVEAAAVLDRAVTLRRAGVATRPNALSDALYHAGVAHSAAGELAAAEAALRESAAVLREEDPTLAMRWNALANVLVEGGRKAEAAALLRRALEMKRAAWPRNHPYLSSTLLSLAILERETGRLPEARAYAHEALAIRSAAYPRHDPRTSSASLELARIAVAAGDDAAAASLLAELRAGLAMRPDSQIAAGADEIAAALGAARADG